MAKFFPLCPVEVCSPPSVLQRGEERLLWMVSCGLLLAFPRIRPVAFLFSPQLLIACGEPLPFPLPLKSASAVLPGVVTEGGPRPVLEGSCDDRVGFLRR